jgi:UDP-N-acetylglucosamine diphosphorylase/glucosamine-1-phosphate N-acetyltransferase
MGSFLLPDQTKTVRVRQRALMNRPWHILDELEEILAADLAGFTYPPIEQGDHEGVTVMGDHPVRIAPGVKIAPLVVFDASQGPVVVDREAVVNPFVVIQGPCYIGPGTEIASHASIRQGTVLGERCKVGGEVSFSIIDSYTNKAHSGYLGHSLIGSWSNLGANTNVSNLKNTYGNIRVQLDEAAAPEDTGRTFQGTIIGDYVRTAIGTRLPTGAVIHTGCMLAANGWAPRFAAPLGFYTDQGRQIYDLEKLIDTIRAMKDRRGLTLDQAEAETIRSLAQKD